MSVLKALGYTSAQIVASITLPYAIVSLVALQFSALVCLTLYFPFAQCLLFSQVFRLLLALIC